MNAEPATSSLRGKRGLSVPISSDIDLPGRKRVAGLLTEDALMVLPRYARFQIEFGEHAALWREL